MSNEKVSHVEEIAVDEAWRRLSQASDAVLIDVRTKSEWAFVGIADLSSIGKKPLLVEWQEFPSNRVDPDFVAKLKGALVAAGADADSQLLFICRSGGRSLMAARAMMATGYAKCANLTEGFEGPLDPQRHRGVAAGWKARGLPWTQG